ncbi:MAG: alanyl-tRNA synthetase, partial [Halothiobacillaceae bacterium]
NNVERILRLEEERFAETLEQGLKILEADLAQLSTTVIPGDTVFRLYDTYGFPVDLTGDIARERGLTLDMESFAQAMSQQKERARAASRFTVDYASSLQVVTATEFTGYERFSSLTHVVALSCEGQPVEQLTTGATATVVLAQSPFYAESGGQVGDTGLLEWSGGEFQVTDTQKQAGGAIMHTGKLISGELRVGSEVTALVNRTRRLSIMRNHSATHLLHAALRELLGEHVAQKGSQVGPDRLRFDFSHFAAVTAEQLATLEQRVNEQIRANLDVETRLMSYDEATQSGAMALFGEKYGDEVRVLRMGDFSVELCGGTHVRRLGDIGLFKITSEGGVASGVRRIEAITGQGALLWIDENEAKLKQIAALVKAGRDDVEEKVDRVVRRVRELERELEQLKGRLASSRGSDLISQAQQIGGVKVLAAALAGVDPKDLRDMVDQLKNKLGSAAVVLATVSQGKVAIVAGVTVDVIPRVKAGDLVNQVATLVGGKGGGRADMAQAGGNDPSALEGALAAARDWLKNQLS